MSAAAHPESGPRAGLVAAAARAFAERGYHGVSMRDLAREVGRSPATFYSHFDSKEDLLFSLQQDAFDTLLETSRAALEGLADPEERLYAFILNHVRYFTAHPDVMRVLIHEAAALPPRRREAIRRRKLVYYALGREIIADLAGRSGARADAAPSPRGEGATSRPAAAAAPTADAELERTTYCAFGMLNWIYGWYAPDEHGSPEEIARTIHRIALHGVAMPRGATPT